MQLTLISPSQQSTTNVWLAGVLRRAAERLHPVEAPPSAQQIAREQLRLAQIALLDAESEAERAAHSRNMLRERVARLERFV